MTDKEKLEKIVAYLVRRMYAHNQMADIGSTGEVFDEKIENAKYEECKDTLNFIDSMQEEPKKCMYSKDKYTDEDRKALCDGCEEECRFNKKEESINNGLDLGCGVIWKDEEPVNDELEEAANNAVIALVPSFGQKYSDGSYVSSCIDCFNREELLELFKAGAKWQKERIMDNSTNATIGLPYENKYGGYTHLIDVSRPLPVGNNTIAIIFKED